MSFDKPTRNALARMVGECRRWLTTDIRTQLQATYGLQPDGTALPMERLGHLSERDRDAARALRRWQDHLADLEPAGPEPARRAAAVERMAHESAFTVLNRLAALRLCEERGQVTECVRRGHESEGFGLFDRLADGALGPRGACYRVFLERIFDEIALDLGVLFDTRLPQSLVFPGEQCLEKVLELLRAAEIAPLWKEDETIGWIYQYFNSKEEREAMRKASQAPRNSRELAVRNQFFTPRYVVEFLTDNTLGRIWYEMRRGETRLVDECRYLVRRKRPVFLAPGESAPAPFRPTGQILGKFPGEVWTRPNPDLEEFEAISEYALTFDGYAFARERFGRDLNAGPTPIATAYAATKKWEGTFEELRCELFLLQRKWHDQWRPTGDDLVEMQSVHRAICERWDLETEHIPHRPKKDPRDLKILDPACGSGHFLLYAFDLLATIYEEAWSDPASPASTPEVTGRSLRNDYSSLDALRKAVPELILRHNLHGIDIDPRACQIAAFALWLRAQRAWQAQGVKAVERPRIRKSHIVCAEPMPGEKHMLAEFAGSLRPTVLGQLVKVVFEKMALAGEAGSLLKIEEEIRDTIAEAKKQWVAGPKEQQGELFGRLKERASQGTLFDTRDISDERFWEEAEARVLEALSHYAESARNGQAYARRLFAEDAAAGFAFVDVCRERYDVILMNPPFGEPSLRTVDALHLSFPQAKDNLYPSFVMNAIQSIESRGMIGCISDRTFLCQTSFEDFRRAVLLGEQKARVLVLADLGWAVLDAWVQTAAYVVGNVSFAHAAPTFFKLSEGSSDSLPANRIADSIAQILIPRLSEGAFIQRVEDLRELPGGAMCFWLPPEVVAHFRRSPRLDPSVVDARIGLSSGENARFYALVWEVPRAEIGRAKSWERLTNGGPYSPFYRDQFWVISWESNGRIVKQKARDAYVSETRTIKNQSYYWRPALSFGKRTEDFTVQTLPADHIFTDEGHCLYFHNLVDAYWILAIVNSAFVAGLLNSIAGLHKTSGYVGSLPVPELTITSKAALTELAVQGCQGMRSVFCMIPETCHFNAPLFCVHGGIEGALRFLHGVEEILNGCLESIERVVRSLYGLATSTRELTCARKVGAFEVFLDGSDERAAKRVVLNDFIGYSVGCVFGRWDLRLAVRGQGSARLPDPFSPLPVCPPGMLQGPDGLPADQAPQGYPLRISWAGLLVDDPGFDGTRPHEEDVVRRARDVFRLVWGDRADAIEQEACELFGVSDLRDYFRKPTGFFADHLKRYSKSRRQAPIYWPLSTKSGSYTVWVYYHRLSDDTLHRIVNDFVGPKIAETEKRVAEAEANLPQASGREAGRLRDAIEEGTTLRDELREMKDELLRVANLPYRPNLDDGVLITASPLWKLFRLPKWRKDLEECWKALAAGEYDWAHLACSIWPERVREVCKKDRSIAIAHDLESICEAPAPKSKKPKKAKAETTARTPDLGFGAGEDVVDEDGEDAPEAGRRPTFAAEARRRHAERPLAVAASPGFDYDHGGAKAPARPSTATATPAGEAGSLLAALRAAGKPLGKAALLAASGIAEKGWDKAIRSLKESGQVIQEGEKRGVTYRPSS